MGALDRARHELTCASCGAPLREMKSLPREKQATAIRPAPVMRPVSDFLVFGINWQQTVNQNALALAPIFSMPH